MAKKTPHFRQLINPIGEEKADLGLSFASRHFRIRVALSRVVLQLWPTAAGKLKRS